VNNFAHFFRGVLAASIQFEGVHLHSGEENVRNYTPFIKDQLPLASNVTAGYYVAENFSKDAFMSYDRVQQID
jgi:hypothetical protein